MFTRIKNALKYKWYVLSVLAKSHDVNERKLFLIDLLNPVSSYLLKQVSIGGVVFDNNKELYGLYQEIFVNKLYDVPVSDCKVIHDYGSNTGLSILRFKSLYPDAVVRGFEPSTKAYGIMERNLSYNKVSGVDAENVLLSDHYGKVRFNTDSSSYGNTAYGLDDSIGTYAEAVDVADLVKGPVDLIKMDVEEGEYDILARFKETGKFAFIRNMIIEFHNIDERDMGYWFRVLLEKYDLKNLLLNTTPAGKPFIVVWFKERNNGVVV